jgi:hypothetical protein
MISHRYDTTVCPACQSDLTQRDQVNMLVSVGGHVVHVATHLDSDGQLIDVDRLIANGYESDVHCAVCDRRLTDHEVLDGRPALHHSEIVKAVGFLAVQGKRLADGRLQIGESVVDAWPDYFEINGVSFDWSEEEDLGGGEVQAIYHQE